MTTVPQPNTNAVELGREILAAAQELAEAGYRVFPVHGIRVVHAEADGPVRRRCTCGNAACPNPAKHPVGWLVPNGHNGATLDARQVVTWFKIPPEWQHKAAEAGNIPWAPWNLGVATGRGLVVVDADVKQSRVDLPTGLEVLDDWESWANGFPLQTTRTVQTGSGGIHLWYAVDPLLRVSARNRVLPGIDLKGDGGYVLAAPSVHMSGGNYTVTRDLAPAYASTELVTWMLTAKGGRYISRKAGDGLASVPDDYNFQQIVAGAGCPAGHRDYFVNDLCFRLRRAGTSLDDAGAALHREWLRMEQGDDPFPWEACVYKLRRVWDEVEPGEVTDIPAWRPNGGSASGSETGVNGVPPQVDGVAGADSERVETASGATALELLERPDLTRITSDTGNGIRFAQRMRETLRYCTGEQRWYLWEGGRWRQDTLNRALLLTEEVVKDLYVEAARLEGPQRETVENWARSSQSAGKRRAMLEMASAQPGTAIEPDELDADPWILAVENGTVDLRVGKLRESDPADLCTRKAGVRFDPAAECPLWLAHLEFVTRGDRLLEDYLRRAAGYSLTGLTGEQKIFFLWGNGANGKSTFVDVLAALLGSYATQADENLLTGTGGHPTQLADLRGTRLVVADETDKNKKLAEQRIKMMTGKKIKARFMRQDFFSYTPRFKMWVSGNHKPEIQGNDDGIWRRLKLVPFTATLDADRKILDYDAVLMEELPGILNWALSGLRDWAQVGQLGDTETVEQATREYREEEDSDGLWLSESCELGEPDCRTEFSRLYDSYRWWCAANGIQDVKSSTALGRELAARGLRKEVVKIGGKATRVWYGIRLAGDVNA